jgi:hypothetical protein
MDDEDPIHLSDEEIAQAVRQSLDSRSIAGQRATRFALPGERDEVGHRINTETAAVFSSTPRRWIHTVTMSGIKRASLARGQPGSPTVARVMRPSWGKANKGVLMPQQHPPTGEQDRFGSDSKSRQLRMARTARPCMAMPAASGLSRRTEM